MHEIDLFHPIKNVGCPYALRFDSGSEYGTQAESQGDDRYEPARTDPLTQGIAGDLEKDVRDIED